MEKFILKDQGDGTIELEAFGFSFEEVVSNAASGLASLLCKNPLEVHHEATIVIEEKADTLHELATFLLSDVLAESDSRDLLLGEVSVEKFSKHETGFYLMAAARGGTLEGMHENLPVKGLVIAENDVKETEKGRWSLKATVSLHEQIVQ